MNRKVRDIILLGLAIIIFTVAVGFAATHPYGWRFDELWIPGHTQEEIIARCGEPSFIHEDRLVYVLRIHKKWGQKANYTIHFENGYATHTSFEYKKGLGG
ncbi:MAG: hypothetical protein IKK58_05605 [Clostridia bacterium]|nr:hypothetical protein [Clostridia bacterium]